MKLIIKTRTKEQIEENDYQNHFELYINEKLQISVGDSLSECPEDATLGRDLNFVFGIKDLIKMAYDAGKNGEPFNYEKIEGIDD